MTNRVAGRCLGIDPCDVCAVTSRVAGWCLDIDQKSCWLMSRYWPWWHLCSDHWAAGWCVSSDQKSCWLVSGYWPKELLVDVWVLIIDPRWYLCSDQQSCWLMSGYWPRELTELEPSAKWENKPSSVLRLASSLLLCGACSYAGALVKLWVKSRCFCMVFWLAVIVCFCRMFGCSCCDLLDCPVSMFIAVQTLLSGTEDS